MPLTVYLKWLMGFVWGEYVVKKTERNPSLVNWCKQRQEWLIKNKTNAFKWSKNLIVNVIEKHHWDIQMTLRNFSQNMSVYIHYVWFNYFFFMAYQPIISYLKSNGLYEVVYSTWWSQVVPHLCTDYAWHFWWSNKNQCLKCDLTISDIWW